MPDATFGDSPRAVPPSPAHLEAIRYRAVEPASYTGAEETAWEDVNALLAALDALSPAPPAEPEASADRWMMPNTWALHVSPFHRHRHRWHPSCDGDSRCLVEHPDARPASPAPPSPEPGEAERLLREVVESLEAAGLTPHTVTDARLPAVRHYNQTRKTAVAWLAARPRPEEADPA